MDRTDSRAFKTIVTMTAVLALALAPAVAGIGLGFALAPVLAGCEQRTESVLDIKPRSLTVQTDNLMQRPN
jgi:hypothetical protein